jgi:hypothetical protein
MTEACKERTLESRLQLATEYVNDKWTPPWSSRNSNSLRLSQVVLLHIYTEALEVNDTPETAAKKKRPPCLHQVQKMSRSSRSLPRPAQDIPRSSPQAYPRFAHNVTHCGNHYHICSILFRGFKRLWVYGKHFAAGGLMALLGISVLLLSHVDYGLAVA